jgi:hypothetical protein
VDASAVIIAVRYNTTRVATLTIWTFHVVRPRHADGLELLSS